MVFDVVLFVSAFVVFSLCSVFDVCLCSISCCLYVFYLCVRCFCLMYVCVCCCVVWLCLLWPRCYVCCMRVFDFVLFICVFCLMSSMLFPDVCFCLMAFCFFVFALWCRCLVRLGLFV